MIAHGILFLSIYISFTFGGISLPSNNVATAFRSYKLVPDVIPCAPMTELQVQYPLGNITPGQKISPLEVILPPKIVFSASSITYNSLLMFDPDITTLVGRINFRHWIIVNIPGNNVTAGQTIAPYVSPIPLPLTGAHRYTFLLYRQIGRMNFNATELSSATLLGRFEPISKFVNKYALGCPVAGNFFLSAAKYLLTGLKSTQ